jgi:hypothetical protein
MSVEGVRESKRDRSPFDAGEDAKREPPSEPEYPRHLVQGEGFVRKELKPELTQNDVEDALLEGKSQSASLTPLNLRTRLIGNASCNSEHIRIEVEADHAPCTRLHRCKTGHYARATRHVEHVFANVYAGTINEVSAPE